jgi:subtilisin family serine protease
MFQTAQGRRRAVRRDRASRRREAMRLETLEERRLLSLSPFYGPVPLNHAPAPQGVYGSSAARPDPLLEGTSSVVWENHEVLAKSGEWIARFSDVKGTRDQQVQVIQTRLAAAGLAGAKAENLGLDGMFLLRMSPDDTYQALQARLAGVAGFEYLEPNIVHTNTLNAIPNDPLFDQLYGMDNSGQFIPGLGNGVPDADIDAPEAWNITTGSSNVVVAIIDTGIDYTHPDLVDNMWHNPGETPGNGIDDDGNGYVDDYYGYDFFNNDGDPFDDHSHGTHTAGTVGAVGNNALGVAGVNWDVSLMAVKWIGGGGGGSTAGAVAAVNYVTQMRLAGVNVKLSSNSWHIFENSAALHDAIAAAGAADLLFVAAAGNDGANRDVVPDWPSQWTDLPNMITVAATDNFDNKAGFSAYGLNTIDLGAPGVNTLSTVPYGSGYDYFSGTSMATPHVAGVAALAWSIAPNYTAAQIRAAIIAGVDPIPALATDGPTPVKSGGRLNAYNTLLQLGLNVISSTPADGSVVFSPPSDFVINFSDPLDPTTLDASDLLVNGIPADSVVLSNGDLTATFSYNTSPVTSQGLQNMAIAEDSFARISDGDGVGAFNASFRYDAVLMAVVSTVPADGSLVQLPLTSILLNFNEPYDPASVDTGDLGLNMGTVVGFNLIDADTVEYLIDGLNSEGTLLINVVAGALTDAFGNPMAPYSGSLLLDFGTIAYPLPLDAKAPAGSLVYDPSISGFISTGTDTDSFTISVDPGQRITVVLHPLSKDLRGKIELVATDNGPPTVVATRTAAAKGLDAVIQSYAVAPKPGSPSDPRQFTINVKSVAGTTGAYSLQVVLNADVENESHNGAANDSRASAQAITSWTTLYGSASRGAVLGRIAGGSAPGDVYVAVRGPGGGPGGQVNRYNSAGVLAGVLDTPLFDSGFMSDVEIGPTGDVYVALDPGGDGGDGQLVRFDSSGNFVGVIDLAPDAATGYFYPFGFDVASDGTIWVAQPNTGNVAHLTATGALIATYFVGGLPEDVAVGPGGIAYVGNPGIFQIQRLDPSTGSVSFFASGDSYGLNVASNGDVIVSTFGGTVTRYDSFGNALLSYFNDSSTDAQNDPSGNYWAASFFGNWLQKNDAAGNFQFQVGLGSYPIGIAVQGTDGGGVGPVKPPDTTDHYSFTLTAGQSATIAASSTSGGNVSVALMNSSGTVLAVGHGAANINALISDFVATASGTYYVKVTGSAGSEYNLVVTRNASFDSEGNNDLEGPQGLVASPTSGQRVALGAITGGGGGGGIVGYYTDFDEFTTAPEAAIIAAGMTPVQILDITTFDFSTIDILMVNEANNGGLSSALLSALGTIQAWVSGGGVFMVHDRFVTNDSGDPQPNPFLIGSPGTLLDRDFAFPADLNVIPPGNTLVINGPAGIIDDTTLDGGNASSHGFVLGNTLPAGAVSILSNGPDANHVAALSYPLGAGSVYYSTIPLDFYLYGNAPFAFSQIYAPNMLTYGVSLARPDGDVYQINADAGATITVETLTPGDGAGEFVNRLDPRVNLYDANGNLVATNDNGAADGRNALLSYLVPAGAGGTYHVEVLASDLTEEPTSGEYVLKVGGTNSTLPPFLATASSPVDGAILRFAPGQIVVDFNDNVLLTSVQAADLAVDGVAATGYSVIDGNTLAFTGGWSFGDGDHTITIAAGAIKDTQGTNLSAFSSTFTLDQTPPVVVSSSIQQGDNVEPGFLVYTVEFSEPMNTGNLDPFDMPLYGLYRGTFFVPDLAFYDGTGTVLTMFFNNVPDDAYYLYLVSGDGSFEDVVGNDLDGDPVAWPIPPNTSGDGFEGGWFYVYFTADSASASPLAVPLKSVKPQGSQIYESPEPSTGTIVSGSDTDDYTIELDAGQTLTVLVQPSGPMQMTIDLLDPSSAVIGTATGSGDFAEVVLQTAPVSTAGTYTLRLGSLTNFGLYSVRVIANAAVEDESHGGPLNDDLGSAQDISGSFISVGASDRGAVLGRTDAPLGGGFADDLEPNQPPPPSGSPFEQAQNVDDEGWNLNDDPEIFNSTIYPHISINGTGDGTFDYYSFNVPNDNTRATFDIDHANFDTMIFLYDEFGNLLAVSDDDAGDPGSDSPFDSLLDGTFAFAGNYYIVVGAYYSFDIGGGAVGGDTPQPGDVYTLHISIEGHAAGGGGDPVAEVEPNNPTSPNLADYAQNLDGELFGLFLDPDITDSTIRPHLSIAGSGDGTFDYYSFTATAGARATFDIDYENFDTMLFLYDEFGNLLAVSDDNGGDPGSGSGLASYIDYTFGSTGTYIIGVARYYSFDIGGQIDGTPIFPGDSYTLHVSLDGAPTPPSSPDYYSFSLDAGQTVMIALTALSGGDVDLELRDGSDATLATGIDAGTNVGEYLVYTATTAGTYYVRVSGDAFVNYSLVVTRDAQFEVEGNDSFDAAQDISATGAVLGHVGQQAAFYGADRFGGLFTIDVNTGAGTFVGSLTPYFASTEIEIDANGNGFNQLPDGNFGGVGFDPATGAATTGFISNGASFTGLEWVGSTLYGTAIFGPGGPSYLYTLDPWSGSSSLIGATGVNQLPGLAYDVATGIMYGITGGFGANAQLLTIDLGTGVATVVGPTGFQAGSLEFGPDGNLYAGGTGVSSGELWRVDPNTGTSTFVGFTGFGPVTGLALHGQNDAEDWYSISAGLGDTLVFETATPADGPGEFVNLLNPHIELYDPAGNLVASGSVLGDGRNERIEHQTLAAGSYRIRVTAEGGTRGEYVLRPGEPGGGGLRAPVAPPSGGIFTGGTVSIPGVGVGTGPQIGTSIGDGNAARFGAPSSAGSDLGQDGPSADPIIALLPPDLIADVAAAKAATLRKAGKRS